MKRSIIIFIIIISQLATCLPANPPTKLSTTQITTDTFRNIPTHSPSTNVASNTFSSGERITQTTSPPEPTTISTITTPQPNNTKECLPYNNSKEIGKVEWVTDGDTIVVNIEGRIHSVRYIGINSPEILFLTERQGPASKRRNIELVEGQIIELYHDQKDRDEYGQLLRYVLVNNVFVNHQLLLEGLALTLADHNNLSCIEYFSEAEELARNAGVGIWDSSMITFYKDLTPTVFQSTRTQFITSTTSPTAISSISNKTPTNRNSNTPTSPYTATITKSRFTINPTFQTTVMEETETPSPSSTFSPANSPSPTLAPGSSYIEITYINYSGDPTANEKDEYIEIKNFSNQHINITSWILYADSLGVDFIFPEFSISPGQVCRIYTNEYHSDYCGFSFESDIPIWENEEGDCGFLFNLELEEISEYCY